MTTATGRGKFTPEQRAAIAEDTRQNTGGPDGSYRDIANRHGCSVATVQKIAKENGLADRWHAGQQRTAAARCGCGARGPPSPRIRWCDSIRVTTPIGVTEHSPPHIHPSNSTRCVRLDGGTQQRHRRILVAAPPGVVTLCALRILRGQACSGAEVAGDSTRPGRG